jgi:hypothetical protein
MKSDTPKPLLNALAMVRGDLAPQIEMLGVVRATHLNRVRKIFEDRNIVGIGIAEKVSENAPTGELSLCFYVEKKLPKSRMKNNKLIPPVMAAPDDKAVFTDVQEIGRPVPEAKVNKRDKPIQSGFSVGHVKITAGTVGALVKKGKKLLILSNSHVLALSGKGKVGDVIIFPGDADRGKKERRPVATLESFTPFQKGGDLVNVTDAALALIDDDRIDEVDFTVLGAQSPLAMIKPKRGMKVVKRGRTTGDTEGEVQDIHFSIVITYPGVGQVGFRDQVKCTRYTEGGDSGSIVVDKETGKIVGLHFAGSPGMSAFNPIDEVVKALKFRFVNP